MPDAVSIKVADAVVDELNGHDFGVAFTAERSYADWDEKLEDLGTLHVDVVPVGGVQMDLESVSSVDFKCPFYIVIRKRFGSSDADGDGDLSLASIDALVDLTQAIALFFMPMQPGKTGRELQDYQDAVWEKSEIESLYMRNHLRHNDQYTGIVRTTYRVSYP